MYKITQDMHFRLSLIQYAEKYGVTKAAIKYKTNRQYIHRWKRRHDWVVSLPLIPAFVRNGRVRGWNGSSRVA